MGGVCLSISPRGFGAPRLKRRSPSSFKRAPNPTMISPNNVRKVGGICRLKFALSLVALVCAVAEASRYKSYDPEPSYGGHYEEEHYGRDYHGPTEYESSHYGSYKPYGHGGYDEERSYKTIGSRYEQEYSRSKTYKQQSSYGGQDYKQTFR